MKNFLFALLQAIGVTKLVAWINRRRVTVLCYHNITMRPVAHDSPDPFKQRMPFELFKSQLDHLQQHHQIISLRDYLNARAARRSLPDYSVVLAFDDGFKNFSTLVAPLLVERELPAAIFVITDKASDGERQRMCAGGAKCSTVEEEDDDQLLSWTEIRTLAQEPRFTFGSHTCSHPKLTAIPLEEVRREMRDSRRALMENLGRDDFPFSYPHGLTAEAISEAARELGYVCAFTTELGTNGASTDLFRLRRVVIASDDDEATFAARVAGLTWWYHKINSTFRRSEQRVDGRHVADNTPAPDCPV